MSKNDKRKHKLFAIPPPTDYKWDEMVALMTAYEFRHECTGGSHFTFEHVTGLKLVISRTHPSGLLKNYQVKAVKDALIQIGAQEQQ